MAPVGAETLQAEPPRSGTKQPNEGDWGMEFLHDRKGASISDFLNMWHIFLMDLLTLEEEDQGQYQIPWKRKLMVFILNFNKAM